MEARWKDKERLLRREEIAKAALELFSKRGFDGTTMAEIARKAGMGVGTLYQFFRGKEDLYLTLLEERCAELLALVEDASREEGPIEFVLDRVLKVNITFVERHKEFFRLYLSEQLSTLEEVRRRLGGRAEETYSKFFELFHKIIQRGIQNGELKELTSAHITRALLGILNSFFFDWLKGDISSLSEVKELALQLFLEGARR